MAKRTSVMTDIELAELAVEYRARKAEAEQKAADAAEIHDRLLAEVERRKTKVATSKGGELPGALVRGVKILRLVGTQRVYDVEKAKARLKPAVFNRITFRVVGRKAVEAALEANLLSDDDVAAFTTETPTRPYVRVFGDLVA